MSISLTSRHRPCGIFLWMIRTFSTQTLLVFHMESTFYFFGQLHFYAQFFFCHLHGLFYSRKGITFTAPGTADLTDGV